MESVVGVVQAEIGVRLHPVFTLAGFQTGLDQAEEGLEPTAAPQQRHIVVSVDVLVQAAPRPHAQQVAATTTTTMSMMTSHCQVVVMVMLMILTTAIRSAGRTRTKRRSVRPRSS